MIFDFRPPAGNPSGKLENTRRSGKLKNRIPPWVHSNCGLFFLVLLAMSLSLSAHAGGTWAPLAHPPPAGLNNALLLSDGTVMAGDGGQNWYRLTPDIHGSYVNGTWTTL